MGPDITKSRWPVFVIVLAPFGNKCGLAVFIVNAADPLFISVKVVVQYGMLLFVSTQWLSTFNMEAPLLPITALLLTTWVHLPVPNNLTTDLGAGFNGLGVGQPETGQIRPIDDDVVEAT